MSPGLTFGLTVAGVLLAGLPLLHLTAPQPQKVAANEILQETPSTTRIFARVQFTGKPHSCTLRFGDDDIATMPLATNSPWETELDIPQHETIELEAEIHWEEDSPENAVSITLEPPQKEARTDTRWTGEDGALLHDIFIFSW